jgi:peptidyl-tRNA hydrolase ICT1
MQLVHLQSRLFRNAQFVLTITRRFASNKGTTQSGVWDESELSKARDWLSTFNINSIPRNICAISFSRSSGPGGQNVNKYVINPLYSKRKSELVLRQK